MDCNFAFSPQGQSNFTLFIQTKTNFEILVVLRSRQKDQLALALVFHLYGIPNRNRLSFLLLLLFLIKDVLSLKCFPLQAQLSSLLLEYPSALAPNQECHHLNHWGVLSNPILTFVSLLNLVHLFVMIRELLFCSKIESWKCSYLSWVQSVLSNSLWLTCDCLLKKDTKTT